MHTEIHKETWGGVTVTLYNVERLQSKKSAIRFFVLWRDKFTCIYCGKLLYGLNECVDHVLPESDMGSFGQLSADEETKMFPSPRFF